MKLKRLCTVVSMLMLCLINVPAQISVGMRDNRHVYGSYLLKGHYRFCVEQSLYAEKIGYQTLRGYIGYSDNLLDIDYSGDVYAGSAYNGDYYNIGALLGARYKAAGRIIINARINPHYDSALGYKTCWEAGAGVVITDNINVIASYTTIPEYRMSEKRVRAGFEFSVKQLSVSPCLSVATSGAGKSKTLRALMSFSYKF